MITEYDFAPGGYKSIAQALYNEFDGNDTWRGRVTVAVDTLDGGTVYLDVSASMLLWWDEVTAPDGDFSTLRAAMLLAWDVVLAGIYESVEVDWNKVYDELLKL